jgi:hypothetical protein
MAGKADLLFSQAAGRSQLPTFSKRRAPLRIREWRETLALLAVTSETLFGFIHGE